MKQGILLAAGFSRRFGANKLLQPLLDGRPMALTAAVNLRAAVPRVLAVVNSESPELMQSLAEYGIAVTVCPDAAAGLGASLGWAVRASARAEAWIIALADMPFIEPTTIRRVAEAVSSPWDIAAPVFRGQRGHPVGFGCAYFDSLARSAGDHGANAMLAAQGGKVQKITCDDPGVVMDIDTRKIFQKFCRESAKD